MMYRARTIIKLCLTLLIIPVVSYDWKPNNDKKETVCNTAQCKARGEEYKKNLNIKVNPCQDFYSFACGNWRNNHPGPKYAPMWSILYELNFEILYIIRKILESYNFQQGDDFKFRQAKLLYDYCVKIPQYPSKEAKHIAREISNIGRVPATPLWDIHSKYLHLSGESALFGTKILTSPVSKDLPLLMLLEPHSAYGSIYHENVWKPREKQAYTDFLFRIIKNLKLKDSDEQIRERIDRVFVFREKLNVIIRKNKKKPPDGFSLYTGQDLDNWFSQTLGQITSTQKLLWREVIEALLQHLPRDKRQTRNIIAMRQKEYFLELMDLLKQTSENVIASHMEIYFVESHLQWDEETYKLLEGTSIEPHSFYSYIRDKYYPRWHICIKELNMKKTFEKLLYHKWFPKDYTNIIRTMNSRIKLAIDDQMEKSKWLDKPTREVTARKINNVMEWIGFPPWLEGNGIATVMRNPDGILTAQASLIYESNVLYVQAPLLLPSMFSPDIPKIYNYASMGSTLGHELYHVINDCGQRGKTVWWELAMRSECLKRKALFIDGYNKVTDRELQNRYNIGLRSDTTASILEDLPDVMGLKAAYNAYKELLNKDESVCQVLPGFEEYSCDQMFYIAFANSHCGFDTRKTAEIRLLEKSAHSLDSIRVTGTVTQMISFAKAFECPVGTPMNPHDKLDLWK